MRYLPNTAQNQRAMLETIGARGIEDLLVKIPAKARLARPLALPPALAETELVRHLRALATSRAHGPSPAASASVASLAPSGCFIDTKKPISICSTVSRRKSAESASACSAE